jgi:hypothetical protein
LNPPTSFAEWAVWIITILAVGAIAWVAITYLNLPIPPWAYTIIGIVLLACLAIWAIRTISRA